tara:strand:- start:4282 stop:5055 length:774 start_codon:yes stop_codon:yes gene_type:complete
MRKTKIATLLVLSIISSSALSQEEPTMKKEEQELQNLLSLIEGKISENELKEGDKKLDEEKNTSSAKIDNKISSGKKKIITIEEYLSSSEQQQLSSADTDKSQFKSASGDVDSYDHVYLLNIPVKTELYANKDIYIYPYRDGIIYKDGEIISKSPLEENVETTFCYLRVPESGTIRRFKSSDDKSLTIENNYSTKQVFSNEEESKLDLYQSTFYIDNDHIDFIRCLTTEKKMPMTIGDMQKQMGNLFTFKFPEIVDI